jgi:hypothetical protein
MRQKEVTMQYEAFRDVIPMATNSIRKLENQGVNTNKLLRIFSSEKLTDRQKRDYLESLEVLPDVQKDNIWERYIGDNLTNNQIISSINYILD